MNFLRSIATSLLPGRPVDVPELPGFDLARYLGQWYEIARTHTWFERGLSRVEARYALRPNGCLQVVNKGYDAASGQWKTVTAKGVPGERPNDFKVYFVPLFYGHYKVAWVDLDYERAFVSGGSLRYAWLLARAPSIAAEQQEEMFAQAERLGYDRRQFIFSQPGGREGHLCSPDHRS